MQGTDGNIYGTNLGLGADGWGTVFQLVTGLSPFVKTTPINGAAGTQVIIFGIASKSFAISEGLRPSDGRLDRMYKVINLEVGIAAGLALVFAGVACLFAALWYWKSHGFGALNYSVSQRIIIPGVTAIVLGLQTVFSSFLLSVFGLSRR